MGVCMKGLALKNHFQPKIDAALSQFFAVKAGFAQRLYIQNTYPANSFHGNYPYGRRFPDNIGDVDGWVGLKKTSEVFRVMPFLNVVGFDRNGFRYLLDEPRKIVLLGTLPMFLSRYCRQAQNVHVFCHQFRYTGLLHFDYHLGAVNLGARVDLSNRGNADGLRVKRAEYLINRTT